MSGARHDGSEFHVSNLRRGRIKSSLFSGIMLAYWDNVMGPMIAKVWIGNEKVEITEEIINYVSNHTLSGELCRQTEQNTIDPKLYVLSDLGYIFFASIFNGHSKMGQTISSLSFIMSYKEMEKFLLLQDYVNKQVKQIVLRFLVLQRRFFRFNVIGLSTNTSETIAISEKDLAEVFIGKKDLGTAVKYFSSYLKAFIRTIDSLEELTLPAKICINETIFGESEEANDVQLLDSKFLMRSITSHLQTCGCTIVVGTCEKKINLFIRTLALFLSPSERYCSRYAHSELRRLFGQDLFLQGILHDRNTQLVTSSKEILLNSYPVTLINVDQKTVRQTSALNEHGLMRKKFMKVELAMLLQEEEAPVYPILGLFTEEIGDIAIMVQKFVTELFAIPNKCAVRGDHSASFVTMLKHKARAFVSYAESRSEMGKEGLNATDVHQLKQDLSLSSEPDFRIVMAAAEKLRPGLSTYLVVDAYRRDRQYQAILETF